MIANDDETIKLIVKGVAACFAALTTAISVLYYKQASSNKRLEARADNCDNDRTRLVKWSFRQDLAIYKLENQVKEIKKCPIEKCPHKDITIPPHDELSLEDNQRNA